MSVAIIIIIFGRVTNRLGSSNGESTLSAVEYNHIYSMEDRGRDQHRFLCFLHARWVFLQCTRNSTAYSAITDIGYYN